MKKIIYQIKKLNVFNLINNLLYLLRYSIKYELQNSQNLIIEELRYRSRVLQEELLYYKIVEFNKSTDIYKQEIDFIRQLGHVAFFPYKETKKIKNVIYGYDINKKLPYVIHVNNKKLYFPKEWDLDKVKMQYEHYIQTENILGGDYLEKSPHQYQSEKVFVNKGDLVIDVGAAEALFSLDIIEKAGKIVIIESDIIWIDALEATFEPYKEKVRIINKKISTVNSSEEISLQTCLENEKIESVFIKMDIEGYESSLIGGNREFFLSNKNISISCCTYHNADDADRIKQFFDEYQYLTEFSDGYILYYLDETISAPYFRKGVIRATNKVL